MKPILIVDDEVDLLDMMRAILEVYGYDVATASNGREALTYLLSDRPKPALILLDLTMPIMNGLEFLERLHCGVHPALSKIPIVVISAVESFVHLQQFQCAGILKKPAQVDTIVDMAERFVARA